MTDLTQYTHAPAQPRDAVDGWVRVIADVQQLANVVAGTEFVPAALRGKPAAVTAAILSGRELGLAPMASLQHVHMIDGRPSLSALMQRALTQAHGHRIVMPESTNWTCTLRGYRLGEDEPYTVTWTMDDAKRAGLDRKTNWQRYPRAMLLARATGELCRVAFADVVGGMPYTSEELADLTGEPDPGAPMAMTAESEPATRATRRRTPVKALAGAEPAAAPQAPTQSRVDPPLDPPPPVTGSEHVDSPPADGVDAGVTDPPEGHASVTPEPEPEPEHIPSERETQTAAQRVTTMALLRGLGVEARDDRMHVTSALAGRAIESFAELDRGEVSALIDTLERVARHPRSREYLRIIVDNGGLDVPEFNAEPEPEDEPAPEPDEHPGGTVSQGPWNASNPQPSADA